ncbi:RNA polymerase sigma factor [Pedobacter nototheniae]|uniref:RNA polymerase sigma factor n=1 Tax=Pedobacter nototheniae TaxID=2488994 RepID=UPI00103BEF05|nr:RNA polymerase sigma-70 factor [Pedobacter nototheniae]
MEPDLLSLLAKGNEDAFRILYQQHRKQIYKVAYLYVKSTFLAEDIVQNVFVKVWEHRENMTNIRSFESWIYTLTKNMILNYHKRIVIKEHVNNAYQLEKSKEINNDTDHKLENAQYQKILQEGLELLSQQQQAVYHLIRNENLSYEETGKRLGISRLTVKTHFSRALQSLRVFFKSYGEIGLIIIFTFFRK